METWLLLIAYRKLPPLYPMVPSPTFYDLPFSHNTARLAYVVTLQSHVRSVIFILSERSSATSY